MSDKEQKGFTHEKIETNSFLMIVLILIVVSFGGLVEIVPLFFQKSTTQPVEGLKPCPAAIRKLGRILFLALSPSDLFNLAVFLQHRLKQPWYLENK